MKFTVNLTSDYGKKIEAEIKAVGEDFELVSIEINGVLYRGKQIRTDYREQVLLNYIANRVDLHEYASDWRHENSLR